MGHVKALTRKGYLHYAREETRTYRLVGVRVAIDDTEAGRRLREAIE